MFGPQYSAAISGGRPGAPITAIARLTFRYSPISLTAVFNMARGVCWRKIFWFISEIFERSRRVSTLYVPVLDAFALPGSTEATGEAAVRDGSGFFAGAPFGHQFAVW